MVCGGAQVKPLHRLAKLHGIYTSYRSAFGSNVYAPEKTLRLLLDAMGIKAGNDKDIHKEIKKVQKKELTEPVIVAWEGRIKTNLYTQAKTIHFELLLENNELMQWKIDSAKLPGTAEKILQIKNKLPFGYHRLKVKAGKASSEALVISAPKKAYSDGKKHIGFFAPLYALQSGRSLGAGDFNDMQNIFEWVKSQKADVFATLPLTATFSVDPSPYSPASLLFWNEFYVCIEKIPEFKNSDTAKDILEGYKKDIAGLRKKKTVDYKKIFEIKRKVLNKISEEIRTDKTKNSEFLSFLKNNPAVKDYAKFRAGLENHKTKKSFENACRYFKYCQWKAEEQISDIQKEADRLGISLYFDLPVGVHQNSFDAKNNAYLKKISIGAPPDQVFTGGQKWGFPPMHPELIRKDGYSQFIQALRKQMKVASFLRIDHIMGLHRLFWIPEGMANTEGTYVSYNSDEFYAILSLESHRNKCSVFGENLGTVPNYVNKKMKRHNIGGLSVFQFLAGKGLPSISSTDVACLNTHDTPTFAGFLKGKDIIDSLKLNLLSKYDAKQELALRKKAVRNLSKSLKEKKYLKIGTKRAILKASIKYLINSKPKLSLINIEDLWLEKKQQNRPGTIQGNWKHKLRYKIGNFPKSLF